MQGASDDGDYRCKHDRDFYLCEDCEKERLQSVRQKKHELSVRKQQSRLRVPRWKNQP